MQFPVFGILKKIFLAFNYAIIVIFVGVDFISAI